MSEFSSKQKSHMFTRVGNFRNGSKKVISDVGILNNNNNNK